MVRSNVEIKKVVADCRRILSKRRIRVSKMLLYGSYAKGNPRPYSDIDLIIILPDFFGYPLLKRQELLSIWTMDMDAPVEIIGYTPAEFQRAGGTIFGQILKKTAKFV